MKRIYNTLEFNSRIPVWVVLWIILLTGAVPITPIEAAAQPGSYVYLQDAEDENDEEAGDEEAVPEEEPSIWDRIFFWRSNRGGDEEEQSPYANKTVQELNAELFDAIKRDEPEIVTEVLEYGAETNVRNNHRRTPLIEASRHGRTEIVIILVEHRASVNAQDMYGGTAYSYANQAGYSEIVYFLLENGAVP